MQTVSTTCTDGEPGYAAEWQRGHDRHDLPFSGRWRLAAPEALRAALDWPHAKTRRIDRLAEAVVAELLHVGRSRWTSYSRREAWYASASGQYLPADVGYTPMIAAVDQLDDLGIVDHDRKKPNANRRGYQSRVRASARLMAVATTNPPLRCAPPCSPLILRGKDGHLIGYRQTAWTRTAARNVATIEEALASVRADLDHETPCAWRHGNFLETADRKGDPYNIHIAHVPVYRVFNGGWESGGRFSGPPYQSWPPESIRSHITLGDQPTAELDYGQTHLRMLCARVGLDIQANDLFDIGGGFERDLVKLVFYILINATSLRAALLAVADKKPRYKGKYALAAAITEAIKERFPALAPHLHSGAGFWLMRLESDIAESVLLDLARRGITALPVHDSFVTEAKNAAVLEEAMIDSWAKFVGSKAVVSRKKKPIMSGPLWQDSATQALALAGVAGFRVAVP